MFGHDDSKSQQDTGQLLPDAGVTTPNEPVVTAPAVPLDTSAPSASADFGAATPAPVGADTTVTPSVTTPGAAADNDDLLHLKQQALQQLSPLVGHLEQTPEEKFRTTMMLIQASDNAALIKDAYEAANAITDEKAKAQALLDIVNEINYFTQHHEA